MGKYRRYKNRAEMFLSSEKGKRILNFVYSWGAAVVIIGAMFKLLYLPYANWVIGIALSVEALVFFIFAFEKPSDEYHWEDVFPALKSKNPMDRMEITGQNASSMIHSESPIDHEKQNIHLQNRHVSVPPEETGEQPDNINNLNNTAGQYQEQLTGISRQMERLSQVTHLLTDASETLLNSFQSITDNSEGIQQNARGYVQQMETLNRNIAGLNTIYEIQLKGISSQIDSIEQINTGLNRIKELYDGSVTDSSLFRSETEKMTHQLTELNQVYSRLLQAMTVNMPGATYQQPPYSNNPENKQ